MHRLKLVSLGLALAFGSVTLAAEIIQVNNNASVQHTDRSALPISTNGSLTQKPDTTSKEQSPLEFKTVYLQIQVGNTSMLVDPPRVNK